jgi:hypothetical protein
VFRDEAGPPRDGKPPIPASGSPNAIASAASRVRYGDRSLTLLLKREGGRVNASGSIVCTLKIAPISGKSWLTKVAASALGAAISKLRWSTDLGMQDHRIGGGFVRPRARSVYSKLHDSAGGFIHYWSEGRSGFEAVITRRDRHTRLGPVVPGIRE